MIYNFNQGIGWASSGVEYAQAYRALMLRNIDAEAKFIFTDMFQQDDIAYLTENIGFLDSEVIWLYQYFTDFPTSPVTFTLDDLVASMPAMSYKKVQNGKNVQFIFDNTSLYYSAYLVSEGSDLVHRVEIVSGGRLIRKDYYTTGKVFSEFFAPQDGKAHIYMRRFYNRNGTTAYDEITDDDSVMYKFPNKILYSKEELIGYMVSSLNLTERDIVILDRTTGLGQAVLMNCGRARAGVVVHADHFSEGGTDENNILWNNYYEYPFAMHRHLDFYIVSTDEQNRLMREQFQKYLGVKPNVITIPVGGLTELKRPLCGRRPFSVLTACRLASEKHVDWVIEAIVKARKKLPQISLDIYGKGADEAKLKALIAEKGAEDYIYLRGQQDMKEIYQDYELYLSGSTSEGFGLSLLEAVGGGLPIIGFNVRYGNPTFINEGKNGYLIDIDEDTPIAEKIDRLAECVVRLFTEADLDAFHRESYRIAEGYLTKEVEQKWKQLVQ